MKCIKAKDCKADTTWKTFGDTNRTRTDKAGSQHWAAVSLLLELLLERLFFVTEWVVAQGPKNDYPHISLRDNPRWFNKRGIFFLLRSTFVFQKIRKNCTTCRPLQTWRTLVRRVSTQELHSWKVQKQVRLFLYICVGGTGNYLSRKPGVFVQRLRITIII